MVYDLIVIGAGPGGYAAALRAAKNGLKVAVTEAREAGGTCLNRGCVPTKTLLHSSRIYGDIMNAAGFGVSAENVKVDLTRMFANKREVCEKLSSGIEGLFKSAKVDYVRGRAKITAPGEVEVENEDGVSKYAAVNILVATGSVPARPPIPGLDLPGVLTSDELLEGCDHLYRSIVIIGGGVIGVEMATLYSDLGCEVTIIEGLDRLLPTLDREVGQNLSMIFKKRGVKVFTGATVEKTENSPEGLTVFFSSKGKTGAASGEVVLSAIGRRPYFDGLFAPGVSPETDGRRLKVNDRFETSVKGIYAIGDVCSKIQLAHYASAQGKAFADMLRGIDNPADLSIVPGCIYCRPEIASVGLTEQQCKDAGIPAKVGKAVLFSNARTLIANGERSFMKLVANADTGVLLGAVLMCERATDMISELSEAIANKLTANQLLIAMRPHPTFEEALTDALDDLVGKLNKQL